VKKVRSKTMMNGITKLRFVFPWKTNILHLLRITSLLNRKIRKDPLIFILSLVTMLKLYYALSRPLFYSGPDANGYIPIALGFVEFGLTSSQVPNLPLYPIGYPLVLATLNILFGEFWIQAAQVTQIFMFFVSVVLLRKIFLRFLTSRLANLSCALLVLSPAWFVATGEAMYETTLLFFFLLSLVLLGAEERTLRISVIRQVLGSLFLVAAIVTHPRTILAYIVVFTCVLFVKKDLKEKFSILFIPSLITCLGILIFSTLSQIRNSSFTLSSAFWPSMSYNRLFAGCYDFSCLATRTMNDFWAFIESSFVNLINFWSPHSGEYAQGTWFHNISFLSFISRSGSGDWAQLISVTVSILVFGSWAIGTIWLFKTRDKIFSGVLFFCTMSIVLLDILVYGDNRHRLLALIFMIPAHGANLLLLESLVKKVVLVQTEFKVKS
jgi:hypothetical protein